MSFSSSSSTSHPSNDSGISSSIHPPKVPFLIGVAGGTASGKSTVCRKIMNKLGKDAVERQQRVVCISQDSFYRELNERERQEALVGDYNFDHPDALDIDLMEQILHDILRGREVEIPVYDFTSNMRKKDEVKRVPAADVVLFEGILVFYYQRIRELFHMKLFVDTDADTRLSRRVLRDVQERGRDLEFVLCQYSNYVKPAFEEFCLPTKKYADIIIPRGADNEVAIDLIVQNIRDYLTNHQCAAIPNRPTTPTSADTISRPRMFSGSGSFCGSFSTFYGSSPPARPH